MFIFTELMQKENPSLTLTWCFLICQHVQLDHAVPVSLGFVGVHHCSNYHILHPYTLHSFNMGWVVDVVIISFLLCSLFCVDDKKSFSTIVSVCRRKKPLLYFYFHLFCLNLSIIQQLCKVEGVFAPYVSGCVFLTFAAYYVSDVDYDVYPIVKTFTG